MIERRILQQVQQTSSRAAARIRATKNHSSHPHVHQRAGAHRARFLGHKKIALIQSPIAHCSLGLCHREHLGMRGRILEQFNLIVSAGDNFSRSHDDRSDRNFLRLVGPGRESQRFAHEIGVALQIDDRFHLFLKTQATLEKLFPDAPARPMQSTTEEFARSETYSAMKTLASALLALCVMVAAANAATEQELVNQSVDILRAFHQMPERQIPRRILNDARGLAIVRVLKAGFVFSGKGGEGVVVARTGNGWSGPSFIGLGGAGWGLQIGAQLTDFIFVLNTDAAVRAFSRDGNVKLGADVSAAAGPVGRDLQADVTPTAAVYTYSRSKGLFAGVSLEGAIIGTQKTANERYYGRAIGARAILAGSVSPPPGADRLVSILNRY